MFDIEEWDASPEVGGWVLVRRDVPEAERDGLLAANLADGNVYSDTDPVKLPTSGTVFRFVDQDVP